MEMPDLPEWAKWVIGISLVASFAAGIFIGYYIREVGVILLLGMLIR